METIAEILTPQENMIRGQPDENSQLKAGKQTGVHSRLNRLRETKPRFSIERARLFTESFRQSKGEPQVLRWAKALKNVAQHLPLLIEPDDVIVGRGCSFPGRWGLVYPELEAGAIETLAEEALSGQTERYNLSPEDAVELKDQILPFWKEDSYFKKVMEHLPEDTLSVTSRNGDPNQWSGILVPTEATRHSAQWVPDYEKVLRKGFNGLKQEIEQRLQELDSLNWHNRVQKMPFLKAMILTCEAAIVLAHRYAELALTLSEKEKDRQRAKELLQIAEICHQVPENPARTLREAIQSQWFVQLLSRLEQKTGGVISNGRMDQYLYPYYKNDLEEGRITESEAQELFEHLWLNMANYVEMYAAGTGADFTEGYAHWETVTIGGKTVDGQDASNELSHLLLKSKREFPLNFPDLGARIHSQAPDRFLYDICNTIKQGTGSPKLINDEEIIPYYLSIGADASEANDYAVSGCAEARLMNRETYFRGISLINLGAVIEMTLNNGRIQLFENQRFGPETGDPGKFESWDQFFGAFRRQLVNLLMHMMTVRYISDTLAPQYLAAPLLSLLNDTCRNACMDLHTGNVPGGLHRSEFDFIGYATAIDSLLAVKKLVFEEKRLTMEELITALKDNFEGHEPIRHLCLNAPKYGNNDEESNRIGQAVERIGVEFCHQYPLFNGGRMHVRYIPITSHIALGFMVGATPNGRKANTYLSEGTSPSQGANTEGLGAVLLSNAATKCNRFNERSARLLNVKLVPATVEGDSGTRKLMSLVKTWMDLKLWHIQFNIVNQSTLLAAKADPEQYRDLIVRVAGYNAYFTDLSQDLQDEIIERAAYEF